MDIGDNMYRCLINTKEKGLSAGQDWKGEGTGYMERAFCMLTCCSSRLRACFSLTVMGAIVKFWKCFNLLRRNI
jgi:hypothetical protein